MKLEGRKIVISGGSVGIGLAISKKIALEGGTVIMCARNKNNLINAIKELKEISNRDHYYFDTDVSKLEDVQILAKWVKRKFGEIHGLVNCAGVYGPIGKSTTVDMKEFLKTIEINLMGTIYMCSEFSTIFSSQFRKKIINISGGGAAASFPNYSAYATSKVAIVRFTENLSIELKDDDFDVNCIGPGFVSTRIHQKTLEVGPEIAGEEFYENTVRQLEGFGSVPPEKAANLTSFLLSDDSNNISGKFLSAPWDSWEDESFQELLKTDKNFATLRRIDNKLFLKK